MGGSTRAQCTCASVSGITLGSGSEAGRDAAELSSEVPRSGDEGNRSSAPTASSVGPSAGAGTGASAAARRSGASSRAANSTATGWLTECMGFLAALAWRPLVIWPSPGHNLPPAAAACRQAVGRGKPAFRTRSGLQKGRQSPREGLCCVALHTANITKLSDAQSSANTAPQRRMHAKASRALPARCIQRPGTGQRPSEYAFQARARAKTARALRNGANRQCRMILHP